MPPFLTGLAQGAAAHHELYQTYVDQGFTPAQAMQVLMLIMWHGLMNSRG
jgi:hypothetical protein